MHEGWFKARRKGRAAWRRVREISMIAKGLAFTDFPVQAHIVATRRCNLACAYCNEYDDYSRPVDTGEMLRRIDLLAKLGTTLITISGGEPLLHPELDEIIRRILHHGRIAGMITNGYLLTVDRIEQLNRARLDHLQISIDNIRPDEVSKKSLKVLDRKLQLLARHALFHVNINSVVGGGIKRPEDALEVARRSVALGFSSTIGTSTTAGASSSRSADASGKSTTRPGRWRSAASRVMRTIFRRISPRAGPTTGVAAPEPVTSTSAKTGWCTTARNSGATPARRSPNTRPRISAASTTRRRTARRTAPSPARTT